MDIQYWIVCGFMDNRAIGPRLRHTCRIHVEDASVRNVHAANRTGGEKNLFEQQIYSKEKSVQAIREENSSTQRGLVWPSPEHAMEEITAEASVGVGRNTRRMVQGLVERSILVPS
jgi:hypothetical protein